MPNLANCSITKNECTLKDFFESTLAKTYNLSNQKNSIYVVCDKNYHILWIKEIYTDYGELKSIVDILSLIKENKTFTKIYIDIILDIDSGADLKELIKRNIHEIVGKNLLESFQRIKYKGGPFNSELEISGKDFLNTWTNVDKSKDPDPQPIDHSYTIPANCFIKENKSHSLLDIFNCMRNKA